MHGHHRFLANDRGTVSATARPALSGFGLQWAWRRFYQIAPSPGPLQVAASRVLAWSQLARKKAGCLVRARAVLPNRLMNAPRKTFTGTDPAKPAGVLSPGGDSARGAGGRASPRSTPSAAPARRRSSAGRPDASDWAPGSKSADPPDNASAPPSAPARRRRSRPPCETIAGVRSPD